MFGFVWQKRRNRRYELWLWMWGRVRLLGSARMLFSFLNLGLSLAPFQEKKNKAFRRNRSEERGGCPGREQSRESEREGREGWDSARQHFTRPACLTQATVFLVILQLPRLGLRRHW